jgi:hypothetical protein
VADDCCREASLAQMTPHQVGLACALAELGHTGESAGEIRRARGDSTVSTTSIGSISRKSRRSSADWRAPRWTESRPARTAKFSNSFSFSSAPLCHLPTSPQATSSLWNTGNMTGGRVA